MAERERGPRERMVFSAAQLVRRHGVAGTSLRDVVAHARAPRGSLQHYFPSGKEQLVQEALQWAGRYAADRVATFLAALSEPSPGGLFAEMVRQWTDEYRRVGFAAGCPVAAATADCAHHSAVTRAAAADAFETWTRPVADALVGMGVPAARSRPLATLMISSLEGALLIARAERDVRALTTVVQELRPLLDAAVPTAAADGSSAGAAPAEDVVPADPTRPRTDDARSTRSEPHGTRSPSSDPRAGR